ncbi:MAG: thioredoxin [Candidatus Moranbacteria bacterium]|jgi:thioredoxin 1|nr:thioredoxin [Candidatus Moranbacteria bacterium]NCU32389.1 thioredoxin [Candidatus Moranbacteria bacterium]
MAIEFTDKNFKEEVLQSDKVVLVDFWAPWCGPCQMMGPIIDELATEMGEGFKIGKLNVDENSQSASDYGIMSIPAIKVFKNGQIVKEFTGVQNKESLKSELQSL